MQNSISCVPEPKNEPIFSYTPESKEKKELKACLKELKGQEVEIPIIVGGKEIKSGDIGNCIVPHDHAHVLGTYHKGNIEHVDMAVKAALRAKKDWENMPWQSRVAIFLKAADLLATEFRATLNAATMLGQGKTAYRIL